MDKLEQQISDILKAQPMIGATNEDIIAWRIQEIMELVSEPQSKKGELSDTEKDYKDMRRFQLEFIRVDQELRKLKENLASEEEIEKTLEKFITHILWYHDKECGRIEDVEIIFKSRFKDLAHALAEQWKEKLQ